MKNTGLLLICLMTLIGQSVRGVPPFSGTIFIDPDIITAADPTSFKGMSYAGRGNRLMFDRRVNSFITLDAYLFTATFDDGLATEIQVNPEFANTNAATTEAITYATAIGRLPTVLRSRVQTVWIHQGVQPFGGGNNNLLIHTGQASLYAADGILEETFVHEASHTSLDAAHASSSGWLAAQSGDAEFISTYARDNPTREDIAETFLPWLAVRHRRARITTTLANSITSTVPNRLAYFDNQSFNLYPILPRPQLTAIRSEVGENRIVLSWGTNGAGFKLQSTTQLGINATWFNLTNAPTLLNSRFSVTNTTTGAVQFYRLRSP